MKATRNHPVAAIALFALLATPAPADAQRRSSGPYPLATPRDVPVQTQQFGELAAGPYNRLVIRNAMVIPGHGGPPVGPYDIVIEGNTIAEMIPFDPVTAHERGALERPTGDRVIDAAGKYVMPGMVDLHMHVREDPLPLEYVYYLKLAHGVTSMVAGADRGLERAMREARRSASNEILAPRMWPIWKWGEGTDYTPAELESPELAPRIAREMAEQGMHVTRLRSVTWNPELFGAVAHAVRAAGGITTIHLPPNTNAVVNAVDAARLGVTMIEHHYGYAESALDRATQNFPGDYDFNDENARFREAGRVWEEAEATAKQRLLTTVADSLVAYGVTMVPTRVVYEANRDILRAISLPWHEKYTHQQLIEWFSPSRAFHGSYHWDWTSDDEQSWYTAFDLWGDLIYEFNKRGGRVGYGADDSYIWATPGFSNVRELQLLREAGLHNLEVLKAATYSSAKTLRQPHLGLVHPGFLADLIIVDGNPARNLRNLYSFGALTLDREGEMFRTQGVVHTIKDGIVVENARLMEEVARMVAESKRGVGPNPITEPFVVK